MRHTDGRRKVSDRDLSLQGGRFAKLAACSTMIYPIGSWPPCSARVAPVPRPKGRLYEIARLAAHNRCRGPPEHLAKTGQGGAPDGRCTHQGSQYESFVRAAWGGETDDISSLLEALLREICGKTRGGRCWLWCCGLSAEVQPSRADDRQRRQHDDQKHQVCLRFAIHLSSRLRTHALLSRNHNQASPPPARQLGKMIVEIAENHGHSVAIHSMRYNFVRIHWTRRRKGQRA